MLARFGYNTREWQPKSSFNERQRTNAPCLPRRYSKTMRFVVLKINANLEQCIARLDNGLVLLYDGSHMQYISPIVQREKEFSDQSLTSITI